jgi:carboxypeptidase C (cathepsin A)
MLTLIAATASLTPKQFEISTLPGLSAPPTFKQYSGLMPIDDGHGTELFFWFVESAGTPSTDPVAFWTNGGPGASSVAYGFWTEHGPFRLENGTSGVRPVTYDFSWNRIANVLYVEMPSGVGFSQSADATKYVNITDAHAAEE